MSSSADLPDVAKPSSSTQKEEKTEQMEKDISQLKQELNSVNRQLEEMLEQLKSRKKENEPKGAGGDKAQQPSSSSSTSSNPLIKTTEPPLTPSNQLNKNTTEPSTPSFSLLLLNEQQQRKDDNSPGLPNLLEEERRNRENATLISKVCTKCKDPKNLVGTNGLCNFCYWQSVYKSKRQTDNTAKPLGQLETMAKNVSNNQQQEEEVIIVGEEGTGSQNVNQKERVIERKNGDNQILMENGQPVLFQLQYVPVLPAPSQNQSHSPSPSSNGQLDEIAKFIVSANKQAAKNNGQRQCITCLQMITPEMFCKRAPNYCKQCHTKKTTIVCSKCQKGRPHAAKGLCYNCYVAVYNEQQKINDQGNLADSSFSRAKNSFDSNVNNVSLGNIIYREDPAVIKVFDLENPPNKAVKNRKPKNGQGNSSGVHVNNIPGRRNPPGVNLNNVSGLAGLSRTQINDILRRGSASVNHVNNILGQASSSGTHLNNIYLRGSLYGTHLNNIPGQASSSGTHLNNIPVQASSSGTHLNNIPVQGNLSGTHLNNIPGHGNPSGTHLNNIPVQASSSGTHLNNIPVQGISSGTHLNNIPVQGSSSETLSTNPSGPTQRHSSSPELLAITVNNERLNRQNLVTTTKTQVGNDLNKKAKKSVTDSELTNNDDGKKRHSSEQRSTLIQEFGPNAILNRPNSTPNPTNHLPTTSNTTEPSTSSNHKVSKGYVPVQGIIICPSCNLQKTHCSRGLCRSCYQKEYSRKRKANPEKHKACSVCGEITVTFAHQKCQKCYLRNYMKKRRESQEEGEEEQSGSVANNRIELSMDQLNEIASIIAQAAQTEATTSVGNSKNSDGQVGNENGKVEGDSTQEKQVWCLCRKNYVGGMICCDNEKCPIQWYHFGCVNLSTAPPSETKWYCPICRNKNNENELREFFKLGGQATIEQFQNAINSSQSDLPSGSKSDVSGSKSDISESNLDVSGSKSDNSGSKTSNSEPKTSSSGSKPNNSESNSNTSGSSSSTSTTSTKRSTKTSKKSIPENQLNIFGSSPQTPPNKNANGETEFICLSDDETDQSTNQLNHSNQNGRGRKQASALQENVIDISSGDEEEHKKYFN